MSLRYISKTNTFALFSNDEKVCQAAGLTKSTTARGPNGELTWVTDVPYAVLQFYDQADAYAREQLEPLYRDFKASSAIDSDFDVPVPNGKVLMPFQRAGVEYASKRQHTLFGDSMGLGKTPQAISFANLIEAQRVLVIVPGSIRLQWQRQIREWSTLRKVSTYVVGKSKDGINPYSNFVVISYDLVRHVGLHSILTAEKWDLVIADEAHMLKSPESLRCRAIFGGGKFTDYVSNHVERFIALTGTPLLNRPRECYTIARGLAWEAVDWLSEEKFQYRFNPSGMMSNGHALELRGRLPELGARLRCNFMVRRLKADVLKDLPDMQVEMVYVEQNGAIKEVLAREKMLDFKIEDLLNPLEAGIEGQISTYRKEMGIAMAPRVIDHLITLLDVMEIEKLVVFAHHKEVMDMIQDALKDYGIVSVRGGMSINARQFAVDSFVKNPKVRVFQGQLDAAGFGIDGLQSVASHVVVAEPAWSPGTNAQALDRLHRHGQHDNVVAQFMLVEGSLSERILAVVLDKTHTIHETLDAHA